MDKVDEQGDIFMDDSADDLEFETDDSDNDGSGDSSEDEYTYGDDELYEKPSKKQKFASVNQEIPRKKSKK